MTQSRDEQPEQSSTNNGHQEEFIPEKIYEHIVDDVNYGINPETGERDEVIYNKDIIPPEEGETENGKADGQSDES